MEGVNLEPDGSSSEGSEHSEDEGQHRPENPVDQSALLPANLAQLANIGGEQDGAMLPMPVGGLLPIGPGELTPYLPAAIGPQQGVQQAEYNLTGGNYENISVGGTHHHHHNIEYKLTQIVQPTAIQQQVAFVSSPSGSGEQRLREQEGATETASDNFLEVTLDVMNKSTEHDIRLNLHSLKIPDGEVSVKIMVVEMEGKKDRMSDKQANVIGTDLYEIDFKQLHDKHEGKTPNHVMVLGDSGDGKTTLAKRYAQYMAKHKHETECLKDIEMVFYIQVSMLHSDGRHKPFNLLLSQQIGPRMTEALQDTGKKWLRDNSHKALFVIDGLDQSSKVLGGKYANIDMETEADSNTILANVLSGHLFPGVKILSTARWSTFWNLHADYRAKKTVGLRGLDKDRIKELITKLCDQSEKIIHYLWNKAPNLLLLARSPMFLIYILQVLQQDAENPPETLSGIMVLVLRYFSGSDHRSRVEDFMEKLSKLAYHGMRDNRFVFSAKYVSNLQLKFEEMRDLVETNAVLERYQQSAERSDLEIQFSHQSLQEILAALHIVNLSPAKFEECLRGEINESKMNEVRKFTYGILLNPEVMNKTSKWMQGDDKDVDSKRTMMEEALRAFFNGNTARDAHILSLLHESGSDVIKKIGQNIHKVDISEELTSLGESYSVATVLRRCGSLTSVSFKNLEPNPATIDQLVNIASSVKNFKVRWMVVGEQINTEECGQLAELIANSSIFMLYLKCSNQVAEELCPLLQNAKISGLSINYNMKLEPETFAHLADVASRLQVDDIGMGDCDLTAEKLATFAAGLKQDLKVEEFYIGQNKTIESDGFRYVAEIIQKLSVQQLWMENCDLSAEDLRIFSENLQQNDLKVDLWSISQNKTIESAGFRYIPEIIQRLNLNHISMKDCDLSAEDLRIFSQNLQHKDVKVVNWTISRNKTIGSDGFRYVAEIIQKLSVQTLWMEDCDLSAEDLRIFSENLQQNDLKVVNWTISRNKTIESDGFRLIAKIIQKLSVQTLWMEDCDLSAEDLRIFSENLQQNDLKVELWVISQNKTIESAGFRYIPEIIQRLNLNQIYMKDCDLSAEDLKIFSQNLQHKDVKVDLWVISQNKTIESAGFRYIPEIIQRLNLNQIYMKGCGLSAEDLRIFSQNLQHKDVKVVNWTISRNKTIGSDGFRYVAEIIQKLSVQQLCMEDCDLSAEDLRIFGENLQQNDLKVDLWAISQNKTIESVGFRYMPEIIEKLNLNQICMEGCDLSAEDLRIFSQNLQHKDVKVEEFNIGHNKTIESDGFRFVAKIIQKLRVQELWMADCDLSAEDLRIFSENLQQKYLKVDLWAISQNKTIESAGFRYIPEIIQRLNLKHIYMADCDLSADDLRIFSQNLQHKDVKVVNWTIYRNKTIESDGFRYIAEIIQKLSVQQLCMEDCDLSAEDLRIFGENLQQNDLKVYVWDISQNRTIESAGFRYIPEIIQQLNLNQIYMKGCGLSAEGLRIFSQNLQHKDVKMENITLGPSKDLKPNDFQLVVDIMQNATIDRMWFGGCEINSDQLCAFARFLKGSVHQTTSFGFHDVKLHSTQMPSVVEIIQSGRFKVLGFQNCGLTHDHLSALNECLQQNDSKIQGIGIIQDMRNPSDRLITDLCQLLSRVGAGLGLGDWKLSDQHQATLQSALDNLPFSGLEIEEEDEVGNRITLRQTKPSTSSEAGSGEVQRVEHEEVEEGKGEAPSTDEDGQGEEVAAASHSKAQPSTSTVSGEVRQVEHEEVEEGKGSSTDEDGHEEEVAAASHSKGRDSESKRREKKCTIS